MAKNENPEFRALAATLTTYGLVELPNTYRLKDRLVHAMRFEGEPLNPGALEDVVKNRKATNFHLGKVQYNNKIQIRFYNLENEHAAG